MCCAYTSWLAMLCPTKHVRTLHKRLKTTEEGDKNLTEKQTQLNIPH